MTSTLNNELGYLKYVAHTIAVSIESSKSVSNSIFYYTSDIIISVSFYDLLLIKKRSSYNFTKTCLWYDSIVDLKSS